MKSILNPPPNGGLALLVMLALAGISHAQLINVNFTGNESPPPTESGLVGPGDGLGTSWNQFNGPDSPGTLVDSAGAATSVTIDTNFGLPNTLDTPVIDLTILRGSATNFGKGVDNTNVTIGGLEAGGFYDVWLVTLRNQPFGSDGTEQYVGWWSTGNATTSPSSQLVDARGTVINTTTFVNGYNFVLFENVEADGSGNIVFNGVAGPLLDGSNNNHRLGLNGLQIEKTTPPVIGEVDDAQSTVAASPATAFADGASTAVVTVTLRDSNGNGVPDKEVTLANTGGPQAATIDPVTALTTNTAGQAVFSVSSATPGIEVFTATDVTDSLTLTDTASVEFVEVGVLTDAAQSTVAASPPSVLADGSSISTITVTLLDANGFPVSGKDVTLANSGGPQAATISPPGAVTSDANGQAVFSVSSTTIGAEEFTATDTTDSIGVTQIATVGFIDPNAPRLINVNFTAGAEQTESTLAGPAGGQLTRWNQYAGADSTGIVLDSVGAPTTVQVDTNFTLTALDDPTPLTMLRGSMTDFGKGEDNRNVTLSGLDPGGFYNVWLVTIRSQLGDGERYVGWWSTTNETLSPSDQLVDARGNPLNNSTFVEGYNYVLFETVEADENGVIAFTGTAGPLLDGSVNTYRHGINGIQIEETEAPLARIISFEAAGVDGVIDEDANTITLDLPFGTDLATLAPTFTLSSGVCNQTSGSPPSPTFASQNPVDYVVTDAATDPDTVNTYSVTVNVAPQLATLVIDLGSATEIEGGNFITSGPANLPLPAFPAGSILKSIAVNTILEATDNNNFASDLTVLLDPTPGSPGGDFSVAITNGTVDFGAALNLGWASGNDGIGTTLADTKTDVDWAAQAPIDLSSTGLFLGNGFNQSTTLNGEGGTWSGTITLTYAVPPGGGGDYNTWAAGFLPDDVSDPNGDFDQDGLTNEDERAFGLDPTDASSVNAIAVALNPGLGTFSYTRRDPTLSGLSYAVWTSSDLQNWTEDTGATEGTITTSGDIQTVSITLSASPVDGRLFVQVRAD